jgi:hypothetical protein
MFAEHGSGRLPVDHTGESERGPPARACSSTGLFKGASAVSLGELLNDLLYPLAINHLMLLDA